MQDEWRKFNLPIAVRARSGRRVPDLQSSAHAYCEVPTRRGEFERGDRGLEGEVVDGDPPAEIGQDGAAIFVHSKKKVAPGSEV